MLIVKCLSLAGGGDSCSMCTSMISAIWICGVLLNVVTMIASCKCSMTLLSFPRAPLLGSMTRLAFSCSLSYDVAQCLQEYTGEEHATCPVGGEGWACTGALLVKGAVHCCRCTPQSCHSTFPLTHLRPFLLQCQLQCRLVATLCGQ